MIIFNNKGRASNFIKRGSDNRVFDIHSSMHIEELYDWLLHNEGLPEGTTVAQYNTREEPSIFEMPVEENGNAAQTVLNRTVRQYTDSTVSDNYGHTNFVDVMESMKAAKKEFANNADYYRLEAKFNGMVMPSADDGDALLQRWISAGMNSCVILQMLFPFILPFMLIRICLLKRSKRLEKMLTVCVGHLWEKVILPFLPLNR